MEQEATGGPGAAARSPRGLATVAVAVQSAGPRASPRNNQVNARAVKQSRPALTRTGCTASKADWCAHAPRGRLEQLSQPCTHSAAQPWTAPTHLKWRTPVVSSATPYLLQQSMASWSRTEPPGCTMAPTPAWQAISTESFQEKGKKASEASTAPCRGGPRGWGRRPRGLSSGAGGGRRVCAWGVGVGWGGPERRDVAGDAMPHSPARRWGSPNSSANPALCSPARRAPCVPGRQASPPSPTHAGMP